MSSHVRVLGRPPQAVRSETSQDVTFRYNRAASDMVSYEDLLVAQYLEELRKTKTEQPPRREQDPSPYLLRVAPSGSRSLHSGRKGRKARPRSAQVHSRPQTAMRGKPKIDAKFIADPNLWDPATPREYHHHQKKTRLRPASAPVNRNSRPWSANSWGRFSYRPDSGRRTKALYKKQPLTIVVTAFKNGSREVAAKIAAPNMKMLLENCTERLGLGFAARRVFLEEGIEVFTAEDIPREGEREIYVSMGENYKCPYTNARRNTILKHGAAWTMTGVILPDYGKKKKTKTCLSKRMRTLLDCKKVRVMVLKNGKSGEAVEVVSDLSNMTEFLTGCTLRLDLCSHAKFLYDWSGTKITDLANTPMVDSCLQPGGTPVLGPLWVSTGEGFDPRGAYEYCVYLKQMVKKKLKETKKYKANLEYAKDDQKEKVTIESILSLSEDDLYQTLYMAETEVDELESVIETLQINIDELEPQIREQEDEGCGYTMKHIKHLKADDRLVGSKGLKLKVYENGLNENAEVFYFNLREAVKGIRNEQEKIMERLLDELSSSQRTKNPQNPKITALARKLFDEEGNQITNVWNLKYGQEVWLSFGEPFIIPFTYCLQVQFGLVEGFELGDSRQVILSKFVDRNDKPLEGKDNPAHWDCLEAFPQDYEFKEMKSQAEIHYVNSLLVDQELEATTHFLQHKKEPKLVVFPQLTSSRKLPGERSDKNGLVLDCSWQAESQIFMVSKSGHIYCKSFPKLCLGVSEFRVEIKQKSADNDDQNTGNDGQNTGNDGQDGEVDDGKDSPLEGIPVLIQGKQSDKATQQWTFNTDGTMSSAAFPDLCLTYLGGKSQAYLNYTAGNNVEGMKPGNKVVLILTDRLPAKDGECQRFALKQEKFETIGQWKHTDVANPEWNKLAYSWPVKQDGELNENYNWPMESFLMTSTSNPMKKVEKKTNLSGAAPLRLAVLRNGDRDRQNNVLVVGPNVTNWMNSPSKTDSHKHGKRAQKEDDNNEMDDVEMSLHCQNMTIRELEFSMFLDSCTALQDLPFAARRLYDEKGNEHFNLSDLSRDQIVYTSCGEPWIDPTITKAEQQRRFVLSQLTQDVTQIKHYCDLRNPQEFTLEVESLSVNAKVMINRQWSRDQSDTENVSSNHGTLMESYNNNPLHIGEEENFDDNLTAHQRAHKASDNRFNQLKWPWERLINAGGDFENMDPEAENYTNKQMYEKFKPKLSPRQPRSSLQKFELQDGYIACISNPELVLGVVEQDGRANQVVLVKRRADDIQQRWVLKDDGMIRSKHNQQLVLTVSLPVRPMGHSDTDSPITLSGSPVTLQRRQTSQYGRANQLWRYDADSGFISAFYTNELDKEITAANKVDVCTYTVAGFSALNQPGYVVHVPALSYSDHQTKKVRVCTSCARAMRGQCKMEKLTSQTSFSCVMGQAKKLKIKQIGSFRVLNGKVDLSRHEAERTIEVWEAVLESLRKETSVRKIAKEISAAKSVRQIRILAYKNGEGRLNAGEVIFGSSIEGLLSQCTRRLGMLSAASRLYTDDGTIIMDMDDLIEWAVENYKAAMLNQVNRLLQGKKGELQVTDQGEETLAGETEGPPTDQENEEGEGLRETGQGDGEENQTFQQQQHSPEADKLMREVPLPPLDIILRYPIEIWASSGKPFVAPEVVESKVESRKKQRAFRSAVSVELDIEKHILRQLKGRRIGEQRSGEYRGTRDSDKPVILEGHWQEEGVEEQVKNDTVNNLQSHLAEVKAHQKTSSLNTLNVDTSRRLYKQPAMKRVLVFCNGETIDHSVFIWGEDLDQLLDQARSKLSPWKKFKYLLTTEGKVVLSFDEVEKDQVLCASLGRTLKQPPIVRQDVEVKANWSRARKQYGPGATDYQVDAVQKPQINVDPFGPPELALPRPPSAAALPRPPSAAALPRPPSAGPLPRPASTGPHPHPPSSTAPAGLSTPPRVATPVS